MEVVQRKFFALAVERHLVRAGPCALRVVGVRHVESGREAPHSALVHQEPDVFRVVVLVACADVECRPAEHFFESVVAEIKPPDNIERLFVAVCARHVEVVVGERAERLVMQFLAARDAVETPRHKMPVACAFVKPAFRHVDAREFSHLRVRVFDGSVPEQVGTFLVAVILYIIEFQEPVTEPRVCRDLPRTHFAGGLVVCHENLCTRAARRRAHPQDFLEGLAVLLGERPAFDVPY